VVYIAIMHDTPPLSTLESEMTEIPELVGLDELIGDLKPKAVQPRKTVTVDEAAKALGVSRYAAYRAVWQGQIPSIRIGRRLLVPVAKLNEMLGERVA
jgi:excisionase family DNA binding protein